MVAVGKTPHGNFADGPSPFSHMPFRLCTISYDTTSIMVFCHDVTDLFSRFFAPNRFCAAARVRHVAASCMLLAFVSGLIVVKKVWPVSYGVRGVSAFKLSVAIFLM